MLLTSKRHRGGQKALVGFDLHDPVAREFSPKSTIAIAGVVMPLRHEVVKGSTGIR